MVAEGPVEGGDAAVAAVVAVALDAEPAVLAGHRRVLAVPGAVDPHALGLVGFTLQVERHPVHPQRPQAPQERAHLVLRRACSRDETQRPGAHRGGHQGHRARGGGSLTDVEGSVELEVHEALRRGRPHHPGQFVHPQPGQLHVELSLHLVPLVVVPGHRRAHRQVLVPVPNVVGKHHIPGGCGDAVSAGAPHPCRPPRPCYPCPYC